MLQDRTLHLAHVRHNMEKDFEFAVGMIFLNELEAYHKYVVAYAIGKLIGARKAKMVKNDKKNPTNFVCNCKKQSISSFTHEKKYERVEVRCGCLAHFKFKIDNGLYEI